MSYESFQRILVASLLVGCLLGVPMVATAQQNPGATPNGTPQAGPAETATEATTNTTTATAEPNAGAGAGGGFTTATGGATDGGGGGGLLDRVPSASEMAGDLLRDGYQSFRSGLADFLNGWNQVTLTLPAPGDPQDMTSWFTPPAADDPFSAVWYVYWGIGFGSLLGLLAGGIFTWTQPATPRRAEKLRTHGRAFVGILFGWFFLPFFIHSVNTVSVGIAPGPEDFFETPGSFAKLGVGFVLGLLIALISTGTVAAALFFLLLQYVVMFFLFALWPVLVLFVATGNRYFAPIGRAGIMAMVLLPLLKLFSAVLLRLLFMMPLTFATEGAMAVFVQSMGLFVIFILMPGYGAKKLLPSSVTSLGGVARKAGDGVNDRARERLPERGAFVERVRSARSDGGTDDRKRSSPNGGSRRSRRGASQMGGRRRNRRNRRRPGPQTGTGISSTTSRTSARRRANKSNSNSRTTSDSDDSDGGS